jgi:hypothetical protein
MAVNRNIVAATDPLVPHKAALELVMASIDNKIVGLHMIQMKWQVIEISATRVAS